MPKAEKSLKQILYDIRRIEEHRAYLSEKKIRRIYQSLLKDLQGFWESITPSMQMMTEAFLLVFCRGK